MVTGKYLSTKSFYEYAKSDVSVWERIIGSTVEHNTYGNGTLTSIEVINGVPHIKVKFYNSANELKFKSSGIGQFFKKIYFDPSQLAGYEKYISEEKATKELKSLKLKYDLKSFENEGITSPLYVILLKLENKYKERLISEEIDWLEKKGTDDAYKLLGQYYILEYNRYPDDWHIIKGAKYFRKANKPEVAISALKNIKNNESRIKGAKLTVIAAAYKDSNELDVSENYAIKAVAIAPDSYYPHNVLGAIYYQTGQPEKGDKHFDRAIQLGSNPKTSESEIKKSLALAGKKEQIYVAKYLLKKDPKKYNWAEKYLESTFKTSNS